MTAVLAGSRGLAFVAASYLMSISPVAAQIHASERSTLTQHIAGTIVTIDYSRPSLRGRESIFGTQVKWGEVWTPGANKATTLTVSAGVRLAGHEVPAGSYSVWLKPVADGDWTLYLHPDTTLFHVPHPSVDGMIVGIPVTPQVTRDVWESLTWEFQHVRATGAQLQVHWERTLVSVDLGVDAPQTTIAAARGRRYDGAWAVVYGRGDPIQAVDVAGSDHITLRYDEATRQLLGVWGDGEGTSEWGLILIPRADGIFMVGYTMNGELAEGADPDRLWEFTFEAGHPVSFVGRDREDEIFVRGVRVGN